MMKKKKEKKPIDTSKVSGGVTRKKTIDIKDDKGTNSIVSC